MDVIPSRCLVFDLETTCANPAVDRITEIGIVRVTEDGGGGVVFAGESSMRPSPNSSSI